MLLVPFHDAIWKAKLISCFGNAYCIPTTFFKTISKLKLKTLFLIFTQRELCKLWSCFFQIALFKRKKGTVQSPVLYCCISLCVSLFLSLSLFVCVFVNFAFVRKLHTYTLRTFHSILIHTYIHTYTNANRFTFAETSHY